MEPLNRISIAKDGNAENRIGPNKRNRKLASEHIARLELWANRMSPMAITCDVRSIHPPFFMEFCYHDMLGGLNVTTLSAEVTARMSERIVQRPATGKFPIERFMDKYELKPIQKQYRKVAFLAGSNSHNLISQSKLQEIMLSDDEWMIKLHPVTNDDTVRSLAGIYGYHRLIDRDVSGYAVLKGAEEVATMQTSEIYILARYMGKPVTDLTRFDRAWLCAYHHICRLLDGTDKDIDTIDRLFTAEGCGHIRPEHTDDEIEANLKRYFEDAMEIREGFRMVVNQKLNVADRTFTDWQ